jgi:sterol desaturase/sphingolipid hydroxylase (fatty acid hydroxylase superfamily)
MIRYTSECLAAAEGHWLTGQPDKPKRANAVKTIRVFENGFLELISRSHPVTPGVWFGPFILIAWLTQPARIGLGTTAALFAGGVLFFSLFEYGLHRIFFHGIMRLADRDPRYRFMAFMAHGYHHEFPNDRSRLVMPPMISWPLAAIFAVAYYFLLGPDRYFSFLTGTMAGYIAYDWVHYYTHHFHPKWRLGKWLRAYHLRHHFQDGDAFFGISSPLWDIVFGTYRSPLPVKREDLA